MRSHIVAFCLFAILPACLTMTACNSIHATLEQSVKAMLNDTTFDINMLDEGASVMVAYGAEHRVYTRGEIAGIQEAAKKAGAKNKTSQFVLLHEYTSGQFGSITYRVIWTKSVGDETISTTVLSHEIWEQQNNVWRLMYAAMDLKQD